jgi:hypothetical protein
MDAKKKGAEEDARGDGSSIGVMELGPEFLGREELGLSGLCTSLIRGYA